MAGPRQTGERAVEKFPSGYSCAQAVLFQSCHGSIQCRELIGGDLLTPQAGAFFQANDLVHQTCARSGRTAAVLVDAMI